jgi:outer membrane autotransporter protein
MNEMNGRANGRSNKTRITRTFHLAPTTRAIRAALAISMTVLALSGSGLALAGTCTNDVATNTVSCDGAFTNLPGGNFIPVADLTLILGDSAPTSVTPAAGTVGVEASWGGNVGVVSNAAITTAGADGVHEYGSTSANFTNTGSITTNVSAPGAIAADIIAYGDVTVVNNGPINAYSTGVYDVTAVSAYSIHGKVSVDNQSAGTITATAQDGNAIALYASSYGDNIVTNEGTITASTVNGVAVGVLALAYKGNASVTNSGSISATSTNYQALGLVASSSYGSATVANSGTVSATGGQDQSIGIDASSALGSSISNSGHVYATSIYGESAGIDAQSATGTASISNSGSISSISSSQYQTAFGAIATSVAGDASVTNYGSVSAKNHVGLAVGLAAYSAIGSTIANSGYVLAGAYQGNAIGVMASASNGDVNVTNGSAGFIRTVAETIGYSNGIVANAANGNINVINDGTIYAATLHGTGTGILARASGDIYVANNGTINANGVYYGSARGIDVKSTTGAVSVVNTGSVNGFEVPRIGPLLSTVVDGIKAVGYTGVSVVNSGYSRAYGAWTANGIATGSYGGTSITNTSAGHIVAKGLRATGIFAIESPSSSSTYGVGTLTIDNAGKIQVNQAGDCDCNFIEAGTGIYALSQFGGDISVTNSGSIGINTERGGYGIWAYGFIGETAMSNSGSISISAGTLLRQIGEYTHSAYGGASATNSGDITIVAAPFAGNNYTGAVSYGMKGVSGRPGSNVNHGGGDTDLVNTGTIEISSPVGYGMWSKSSYGQALAYNSGAITVNDGFVGGGMSAGAGNPIVSGAGSVLVENKGSVSVTAPGNAFGLRAYSAGFGYAPGIDLAIDNSGYVGASSQKRSQGILAFSFHDDALAINNSGTIKATTTISDRTSYYAGNLGIALGIHATDYAGGATITNSGSITAATTENAQRPGAAAGIFTNNGYAGYYHSTYGNTAISNTGSISASLVSSNATQAYRSPQYVAQLAYGPSNTATGILSAITYGDIAITNAGSISSSAKSDHYAGGGTANSTTTANGISVVDLVGNSHTRTYNLGDIAITNAAGGSIAAYSESSYAAGDTAVATGISARVAVGSYGTSLVSAGHGIAIDNAGQISATAVIANDPTGLATATGISAFNGSTAGYANVTNSGNVFAKATTTGVATATGIAATGYAVTAALGTGGYVGATATGTSGAATGLSASGNSVTASNAGAINATFNGAGGKAYGANLTSAGDLSFTNSGQIFATNVDDAVGVQLNSATSTTLVNSGLISAVSSAGSSIAVRSGASSDTIQNTGVINGALVTGDGNDTLTNSVGGVWNALGTSTDFGTGDDTITNAGTINLHNSAITLGTDPAGNVFTNSGTVTSLGNNTIDMGSANPNPFTNTGAVEMRNGIAGDALTLTGDWAGSGQLGLDVSGLHGTSDKLHIVGNVAGGSVTAVNLNLLDLPTTATSSVPVVDVTGDSTAGSFVLGDVHFDTAKSFLVVQGVDLTSVIDASNATPDVFSVGVAVTGVTDSGALAASFVPGVQSLMASEVGTWRQRMGVLNPTARGSVGLWTRAFSDSGTVNPSHIASNFGKGGNFSFDQTNSGEEIGADFAITDGFSAGLMLGKAQASQHLDNGGVGQNKISGDTRGIYATWMATNGFYLDGSYRTMSFDARLDSQAGESRSTGKADAFNVEVGQSWTIGDGFKLVPQIQYTRTTVKKADTLTGALAGFTPQGGTSSRGRAGVALSKDITNGGTVWTPYASLSAVREFDGRNDFVIDNTFTGSTDTKGTSALVEGGLSVKTGKLEVFGGVNWQDGAALKGFAGGQVGLRYNW